MIPYQTSSQSHTTNQTRLSDPCLFRIASNAGLQNSSHILAYRSYTKMHKEKGTSVCNKFYPKENYVSYYFYSLVCIMWSKDAIIYRCHYIKKLKENTCYAFPNCENELKNRGLDVNFISTLISQLIFSPRLYRVLTSPGSGHTLDFGDTCARRSFPSWRLDYDLLNLSRLHFDHASR